MKRIKQSQDIIPENKELILKFKDYYLSEGIGMAKIERYLFDASKLSIARDQNIFSLFFVLSNIATDNLRNYLSLLL